jgi:hypothetical protein
MNTYNCVLTSKEVDLYEVKPKNKISIPKLTDTKSIMKIAHWSITYEENGITNGGYSCHLKQR